jgi:hypothetical protein
MDYYIKYTSTVAGVLLPDHMHYHHDRTITPLPMTTTVSRHFPIIMVTMTTMIRPERTQLLIDCHYWSVAVGRMIPATDDEEMVTTTASQHHVASATFPIPQPLTRRLEAAVAHQQQTATTDSNVILESFQDALGHLVSNSIQALDALYFLCPAVQRNSTAFQHRLCLRVTACDSSQTLSITNLGIGMTRANCINCLGIGKQNIVTKYHSTTDSKVGDTSSDEETTSSESSVTKSMEEEEDEFDSSTSGKIGSTRVSPSISGCLRMFLLLVLTGSCSGKIDPDAG